MKKIKFIFISVAILVFLYVGLSWFCLDGRIIYITSFNESTITASKKENLFITDKLVVITQNDSLQNWDNDFEIWTNKNYQVKYWGILFHWTSIKPEWRYLNINSKENSKYNTATLCYKKNNNKELKGDFTGFSCNVGDTIKVDFYKCKEEFKLGTLKIVVK